MLSERGDELFVGAVCAVLAVLLVIRIGRALRTGEIPLYRTRLRRAEVGEAKFLTLVALNVGLFILMFVIAADLLLGLGLQRR